MRLKIPLLSENQVLTLMFSLKNLVSAFYKTSLNPEIFTGHVWDILNINITSDLAACSEDKFTLPFEKGKGYSTGRSLMFILLLIDVSII